MFERLWRGDTQTAAAVREQLTTADLQGRALLVDAIVRIDERVTGLEERPPRDEANIEAWQLSVARSSSDIADGLEQLADVCERINERLEEHRRDTQALREALTLLVPTLPQPLVPPAQDQLAQPIATAEVTTSAVAEDDAEDGNEISLVDQVEEISLVEAEDDEVSDDPVEQTDNHAASTILEQLTEVLNRRGDREALRLSTRLRRISTSQWARLREHGDVR